MPTYQLVRRPPAPVVVPHLDSSQQAVVDHPGGPLLVLAGPGTGKTTTLVEAVVERVRRGARPEQILVLTFSRKAAAQLRTQITTRLGRTITEPAAFTFHSFALALLRAYAVPLGQEPARLLSGPERDGRIRELLAGNASGEGSTRWPVELQGALTLGGFAGEVADLLDRARERGLDAGVLRQLGIRAGRPAWTAAGDFLDEYDGVLAVAGELDYTGLIRHAVNTLADPEVAGDVAGRFRAVFVDEYQDTDPAQEQLLAAIAGGGRDLVVVGDPDQSIYRFRGAEVSGLLEFPVRFPTAAGAPAPIRALRVCRRAAQSVLAPSRAVAERIPTPGLPTGVRIAHRDLAATGPACLARPEIQIYPSAAEEALAIADLLRRAHLLEGIAWSQMAVLVRSGVRTIPVLRRSLATAGVEVSVAVDEVPIAGNPAVASLLSALDVADWHPRQHRPDPLTVDVARLLLLSPLGKARPSVLRALGRTLRAAERAAGVEFPRPSAALIRDAVRDEGRLRGLEEGVTAPLRRLCRVLGASREALAGGAVDAGLWALWEGSGWAARLATDSGSGGGAGRAADHDIDAVLALFEATARLGQQARPGVATLLNNLALQQIPAAPAEEHEFRADAVRLLTAHRAKGLEWDLVVVAGVQEGVWPDVRRRGCMLAADLLDVGVDPRPLPSSSSLLAEERRLFYVALTRARRRLVLTAVQSFDDGGERPSRFLSETGLAVPDASLVSTRLLAPASLVGRLRRALADDAASPALRACAAGELAQLANLEGADGRPLVSAADPDQWWGALPVTQGVGSVRPPGQPVALSGSALASYRTCPLRWFLEREVHAEGPARPASGFGKAVHALAQLVGEGVLPADLDLLDAHLDAVWSGLGFSAPWHGKQERRQARDALGRLIEWLVANPRSLVGTEVKFALPVGDTLLRGRIDRLECDERGRLHVVDFKTGKNPLGADELANDPQLGIYQFVVQAGALGKADDVPGGAELVWLRKGSAAGPAGGRPKVQAQPPPAPGVDAMAILVEQTAAAMRAELFPARPNDSCERCAFRIACPAQDDGRQVVE